MRTDDGISELVESYWREAADALSGFGGRDQLRLNIAVAAVDTVWDRHIFDLASTFGGAEVGDANVLSASILRRLLDVEYVALASATGGSLPPSQSQVLDANLAQACQDVLNTFSDELLGPVPVENRLIYAQPIILENPIPVGAVLLATNEAISDDQKTLLKEFLRHLDTRMNVAEHLYTLRRENSELRFEMRKLEGGSAAPTSSPKRRVDHIPDDFEKKVEEIAHRIPVLDMFGIKLPTIHYDEFCRNFDEITDRYLKILEKASNLYLDIPSGIDAKSESKLAAPYFQLLKIMGSLRYSTRLMFHADTDELDLYSANRTAPTFADLTRVAKKHTDDELVVRILDIMNDQGEEDEVDALYARHHPYEFRAANLGEVFALLALYQTLMNRMPESLEGMKGQILEALPKYQAAKAFLLSYDRFEDVPLRGEARFDQSNSHKLLLRREGAPAFGTLLWAYQEEA